MLSIGGMSGSACTQHLSSLGWGVPQGRRPRRAGVQPKAPECSACWGTPRRRGPGASGQRLGEDAAGVVFFLRHVWRILFCSLGVRLSMVTFPASLRIKSCADLCLIGCTVLPGYFLWRLHVCLIMERGGFGLRCPGQAETRKAFSPLPVLTVTSACCVLSPPRVKTCCSHRLALQPLLPSPPPSHHPPPPSPSSSPSLSSSLPPFILYF